MMHQHNFDEPRSFRVRTSPSDRSFGLTMAAVLLAYAVYAHFRGGRATPVAIVGVALGAIALISPRVLHRANVLWTRLGHAMERVVNPIVLGVLWVVVLTPIALLMRLARRDPLRRQIERDATSYWVPREEPPALDSWSQQF